jgi:hypothetical protein
MQLEWIKTELKQSVYEQNKISGKFINKENIFQSNRWGSTFLE